MQDQDVYAEVQKAFDHNFKLFSIDFKDLVLYSYINLRRLFWDKRIIG